MSAVDWLGTTVWSDCRSAASHLQSPMRIHAVDHLLSLVRPLYEVDTARVVAFSTPSNGHYSAYFLRFFLAVFLLFFLALPPLKSSFQLFADTSTSYRFAAFLIRFQARSRSLSDTPST